MCKDFHCCTPRYGYRFFLHGFLTNFQYVVPDRVLKGSLHCFHRLFTDLIHSDFLPASVSWSTLCFPVLFELSFTTNFV